MSKKVFEDLDVIQRQNLYNQIAFNTSRNNHKNMQYIPPVVLDVPIDLSDSISMMILIKSLYKGLSNMLAKSPNSENIKLVVKTMITIFLETGSKANFQYEKLINNLDSVVSNDMVNLTSKDLTKIWNEYEQLREETLGFFHKINYHPTSNDNNKSAIFIDSSGDYTNVMQKITEQLFEKAYRLNIVMRNFKAKMKRVGSGSIGGASYDIPRKWM